MFPPQPRVCSEPGGQKPVLSLSLDRIKRIQTHWVPRLHSVRFEDDILGCISLSENAHGFISYSMKWFPQYTDEWNNKHWGCKVFWYCSLCRTHLIWDRLGPFDIQGWRNMATEGRWLVWYAVGCVKSQIDEENMGKKHHFSVINFGSPFQEN